LPPGTRFSKAQLSGDEYVITRFVMAGLVPRLSGLILVDEAHGMDSSMV
jgi:hypothetical protein